MCVMNQALRVGLNFTGDSAGPVLATSATRPPAKLSPIHGSVPGASEPPSQGRCALVYRDDCLVHSLTLEQHLLDVEAVLEIFRRRKLYAKSSKCEFMSSAFWRIAYQPPPQARRLVDGSEEGAVDPGIFQFDAV